MENSAETIQEDALLVSHEEEINILVDLLSDKDYDPRGKASAIRQLVLGIPRENRLWRLGLAKEAGMANRI